MRVEIFEEPENNRFAVVSQGMLIEYFETGEEAEDFVGQHFGLDINEQETDDETGVF